MSSFLRIFIYFVTLTSFFEKSHSQSNSQIRLKVGLSRLFPSPAGKGYAYNIVDRAEGSVVIGGEFSHVLKSKKASWQVGFTFQDGYNCPTPNTENIIVNNVSSGFELFCIGAPAKTVIYGGFERYIRRDYTSKFKNYFSVAGGLAFAFTLNNLHDWVSSKNEEYLTTNGDTLRGTIYQLFTPSFPLGLAVYGGIRYNVSNKKGTNVFLVELLLHWGLTSFYNQKVNYTLNGVPTQEILKENGNCLQLNFITPLFNFRGQN